MTAEGFSGDAADNADQEYRSLSVLAVLGLLVGLVSPAFLFFGMFVLLPLAGAALSLAALARIAARPEVLTGRRLAMVGLALAVVSLSAGFAKRQIQKNLLSEQAAPVSRAWVEHALAGEVEEAYLLTLNPDMRGEPSLREADGGESEELVEYRQRSSVSVLSGLSGPGEPELIATQPPQWLRLGRVRIAHDYVLRGAGAEVSILLERSQPIGGLPGRWKVVSVDPKLTP